MKPFKRPLRIAAFPTLPVNSILYRIGIEDILVDQSRNVRCAVNLLDRTYVIREYHRRLKMSDLFKDILREI